MPDHDEADLAEVARVYGPFEADLIKNFLESHGIESIVRGRTAPFVYPLTVDGLAEFKVFVQQKDFEKARDLIVAMPAPDGEEGPGRPA
jgi:hypothetical protein